MIEIYQLHYFLATAETQNFTKAARQCQVTQPTLSAGIRKLELALGARLFDRNAKSTTLTAAGQKFIPRAQTILRQCQQALHELNTDAADDKNTHEPGGTLRLGLLFTIPGNHAQKILQGFSHLYPTLRVELFDGHHRDILTRIENGGLDIALTLIDNTASAKFQCTPLYHEAYSLFLSAQHPRAASDPMTAEDLVSEPALLRPYCEIINETQRFFADRQITPPLAYRCTSDERAAAMVLAGIGFAIMPHSYRQPGLKTVGLSGFNYSRQIGLIRPQRPQSRIPRANEALLGAFEHYTKALYTK
ncbi:MAG: LysR family transcriptional regulator [Kordiimonas sp.]|nr:LysR family transcriptional regulator [Kordiimonas sp.]